MLKEEFNERMTAIGQCEDDVQRRTLIASLTADAGADYDESATLRQQNEQLNADIERVQKANMDLFLQVQQQKADDKGGRDDNGIDEPPPKKKFEDLFDEKGAIK